jgi:hypothetical protein
MRYLLSFCLLLFCLSLLVWSLVPAKKQQDIQLLTASRMSLKPDEGEPFAILGNRQLRLIYPSAMRIGDDGVIELLFEEVQGNRNLANLQNGLIDAYTSYNLMAVGELAVTGLRVNPANPIRVSMPPGQDLHFTWRVVAQKAGSFPGRIWLSLRFLPLSGNAPTEVPIYVKEVDIQGTSIFGFTGPKARLAGGMGGLFSLLLIFPDIFRKINAGMVHKRYNTHNA